MICCGKEMRHTNLGYFLCETCKKEVIDELGIIKKALEEHPGSNIIDIVKYTGLPSNVVLKYFRDGTLTPVKPEKKLKGYYFGSQVKARWHIDIPSRRFK